MKISNFEEINAESVTRMDLEQLYTLAKAFNSEGYDIKDSIKSAKYGERKYSGTNLHIRWVIGDERWVIECPKTGKVRIAGHDVEYDLVEYLDDLEERKDILIKAILEILEQEDNHVKGMEEYR